MLKRQGNRFLLAGAVNTGVGLFLFPIMQTLLEPFHIHYIGTLVACHLISVCFAYAMSRWYVFRSKQKPFWEFIFFSTFQWAYFAFNLAALPFLVHTLDADPRVAQFCISLVAMVCSYIWQSHVVFRMQRS